MTHMEPVRAVLDAEAWARVLKEAGISNRQMAFLHGSKLILELASIEIEVRTEFHLHSVDRSKLSGVLGELFEGSVPWQLVARERSELADPQVAAALAAFVRRHPKRVRLDPLEVLRIVTRDDFRCRVCGTAIEAHPRSVVRVEPEGSDDDLITVCDLCRLDLLQSRKEPDPGDEPG